MRILVYQLVIGGIALGFCVLSNVFSAGVLRGLGGR
jgi:hypothetical protein